MSMLNRESLWLTCGQKLLHSETNPIVLYLCKIILFDIMDPIDQFRFNMQFGFLFDFLFHPLSVGSVLIDWIVFFIEYPVLICHVLNTKIMSFILMMRHHFQSILQGPLSNFMGNRIVSFSIGLFVLFWRFVVFLLTFTVVSLSWIQTIGRRSQCRLYGLDKMMSEFVCNGLKSEQQTMKHWLQEKIKFLNAHQLQVMLNAFDNILPHDIICVVHEYIIVDEFSELVDSNETLKRLREFRNMNLEFVMTRYKTRTQCNNITLIERMSWEILILWFKLKQLVSFKYN
eukprot:257223_1